MIILSTSNTVYSQAVLALATWAGTEEACTGFNSISITATATGAANLLFYTGFAGALVLEATVPIATGATARLVLPVSYTAYRCDVLDTSVAPNVVSVPCTRRR